MDHATDKGYKRQGFCNLHSAGAIEWIEYPYSPLAKKLAQTIRYLADRDSTEKEVYCERHCIHQRGGVCRNDAIAVSDEGFCCDYTEKEDE